MVDVKALRASGLTDTQIIAVLEAELNRRRSHDAERSRRYRKKCKPPAASPPPSPSRDGASRDASRDGGTISRDGNQIHEQKQRNGHKHHVTMENETLYMFSSLERKKERNIESERPSRDGAWRKFWSVWPKKDGKFPAQKELPKSLKVATIEEIVSGVERAKASKRWREGYIPYPSKWLKERRWLDGDDRPMSPQAELERHLR